jgi:hypothetical protein
MAKEEFGYYFETFGPFDIPVNGGEIARPPAKWWKDEVDYIYEDGDVSRAIGCYMFAMGEAHVRPWYIGKTINQRGFREEVFTDHKLGLYNWVLGEGYRGPPVLFLFPLITRPFQDDSWRFARGTSHNRAIEWLERTLMGMAYSQNQEIANTRDVTYFRTVHVRGLLGKAQRGRRTGDIVKARQALLGEKTAKK